VDDDEQELSRTLMAMRAIWMGASGASHNHLEALLDLRLRHDAGTQNYLASGAAGTLRDRYFHPTNGDRVSETDVASLNDEYRQLLDEATRLSVALNLPATADWPQTA
jgi:hypothetical protein